MSHHERLAPYEKGDYLEIFYQLNLLDIWEDVCVDNSPWFSNVLVHDSKHKNTNNISLVRVTLLDRSWSPILYDGRLSLFLLPCHSERSMGWLLSPSFDDMLSLTAFWDAAVGGWLPISLAKSVWWPCTSSEFRAIV